MEEEQSSKTSSSIESSMKYTRRQEPPNEARRTKSLLPVWHGIQIRSIVGPMLGERELMSQIWLSKADFTWLIVISHRYVIGFTLLSQLTHSIFTWRRNSVSLVYCYWLFSFVTHNCESHDIWLSHMTHSYESWVSRMWSISDTWLVLWVMIGLGMLRSWLLRVIWWISHYDSLWIMSCVTQKYESRLREEPLYKGTLRVWVWVLHTTI